MRYLITTLESYEPFLTDYFDSENHFNMDLGMVVFDLKLKRYTNDGVIWHDLQVDHL